MDAWLVWLIGLQFGFVAFLIWVTAHYRMKRKQQQVEERGRLIERFQDPRELAAFLDSQSGRKLLHSLSDRRSPASVIAKTVTVGIVLLFVGLGLCGLSFVQDLDLEELILPGILTLVGGLGVLASAAFTAWLYRRAGRWSSEDSE